MSVQQSGPMHTLCAPFFFLLPCGGIVHAHEGPDCGKDSSAVFLFGCCCCCAEYKRAACCATMSSDTDAMRMRVKCACFATSTLTIHSSSPQYASSKVGSVPAASVPTTSLHPARMCQSTLVMRSDHVHHYISERQSSPPQPFLFCLLVCEESEGCSYSLFTFNRYEIGTQALCSR